MAVAGADQRQRAALRHGAPQLLAGERAAQIVCQRRALRGPRRRRPSRADGRASSPRRRRRRPLRRRASAGSRRSRQSPRASSGSPVSASQGAARRLGHPQRLVEGDARASRRRSAGRCSTRTISACRCSSAMPRSARMPSMQAPDAPVVRRQQRVAGDQGDLGRVAEQPRQPMPRRQRQLDAARAAADDREAQPRQAPERVPATPPSARRTGRSA